MATDQRAGHDENGDTVKTARDQALLGLATTGEMLTEIATRLEMTQYDDYPEGARRLIAIALADIQHVQVILPDRTIGYRTVDG